MKKKKFKFSHLYLGLVMAACVPLLTAPTYASDRKNHVERLLCSLPIRPVSLAMGRFLACLAPVAISCALTLLIPAALTFMGGSGMAASLGMCAALFCLVIFCMKLFFKRMIVILHQEILFINQSLKCILRILDKKMIIAW